MHLSRRGFLKALGIGAGAAVAVGVGLPQEQSAGEVAFVDLPSISSAWTTADTATGIGNITVSAYDGNGITWHSWSNDGGRTWHEVERLTPQVQSPAMRGVLEKE